MSMVKLYTSYFHNLMLKMMDGREDVAGFQDNVQLLTVGSEYGLRIYLFYNWAHMNVVWVENLSFLTL